MCCQETALIDILMHLLVSMASSYGFPKNNSPSHNSEPSLQQRRKTKHNFEFHHQKTSVLTNCRSTRNALTNTNIMYSIYSAFMAWYCNCKYFVFHYYATQILTLEGHKIITIVTNSYNSCLTIHSGYSLPETSASIYILF